MEASFSRLIQDYLPAVFANFSLVHRFEKFKLRGDDYSLFYLTHIIYLRIFAQKSDTR